MPYGKQFENTFHEDENGELKFHNKETFRTDGEGEQSPGVSYQGMLFDPHWGTGTSKDPSLAKGEYEEAAARTLRLTSVPEHWDDPETRNSITHGLTEALKKTTIPIHVLNKASFDVSAALLKDDRVLGELKRKPRGVIDRETPEGQSPNYLGGDLKLNTLAFYKDDFAAGRPKLRRTLVHEMGHGLEVSDENAYGRHRNTNAADPIQEGVAEGFADRFERPRLESALHEVSESRRREIGDSHVSGAGYTPQHFYGGTQRALYAATRLQASLHDTPGVGIPERSESHLGRALISSTEEETLSKQEHAHLSDQLVLGEMYHTHPHVRELLDQRGNLERNAAREARDVYLTRLNEYNTRANVDFPEDGHWKQQGFDLT